MPLLLSTLGGQFVLSRTRRRIKQFPWGSPPAHPRGPSGWAHVGPKWVGPRGSEVGGTTWGPKWVGPRGAQSGWAYVGPKWAQARNLGPKKIKKMKILKIKIRSAQNVGKVWINRKNPPGPIWGPLGQVFAWAGKIEKIDKFCLFSLVGPWALFTRLGALAWPVSDSSCQWRTNLMESMDLEMKQAHMDRNGLALKTGRHHMPQNPFQISPDPKHAYQKSSAHPPSPTTPNKKHVRD